MGKTQVARGVSRRTAAAATLISGQRVTSPRKLGSVRDAIEIADLLSVAKVPANGEAADYLRSQLEWLKQLIPVYQALPKPAAFNKPLDQLAKQLAGPAAAFRQFKEQHPLQYRAMRDYSETLWMVWVDLERRLDVGVQVAAAVRTRPGKPKDIARYMVARSAHNFFLRFSTVKPSYAITGKNPFIEFCNLLFEFITGTEADLSTHARIVIQEVKNNRPWVLFPDDVDPF